MMRLFAICCLALLSSCISDENHSVEFRQARSFREIFEFAYHYRQSNFFDSAVTSLNKSLSKDKNFFLQVHDDSIQYREIDNAMYELSKENVVLYNLNRKELNYNDSVYTSLFEIDSLFSVMITQRHKGAIFLYSDTLSSKKDWFDLFSMMDTIKSIYRLNREAYSAKYFHKTYDKLDKGETTEVRNIIPYRFVIYFKNPFPPPQPLPIEFTTPVVTE